MTLRVGVIGTGMIGQDHTRRITQVLSGADIVAVSDANPDVSHRVASGLKNATVFTDGMDLIADDAVDALVVASAGATHEGYVLNAIAAGKPVFCEKPLATTEEACRKIIEAEAAAGRRLVQVGFMRRYDAAFQALKRLVDIGTIGAPLMYHSGHRNASVPAHYTKDMAILDTAVHDVDITRWLLNEELTAVQVLAAKPNSAGGDLLDPLLMILRTESGVLVTVETSVNIAYGYDIRGEIVGERGTAALADWGDIVLRSAHRVGTSVPEDWRERFVAAYDAELQEWINASASGEGATGPSSWDGYAAQVVCGAGVRALESGAWVTVELIDKPAMYA
jgi:myo-inositol 2-dehydrogenase/D-chiro-inositol 1-dehydrogenase